MFNTTSLRSFSIPEGSHLRRKPRGSIRQGARSTAVKRPIEPMIAVYHHDSFALAFFVGANDQNVQGYSCRAGLLLLGAAAHRIRRHEIKLKYRAASPCASVIRIAIFRSHAMHFLHYLNGLGTGIFWGFGCGMKAYTQGTFIKRFDDIHVCMNSFDLVRAAKDVTVSV